jgi:hypothetical protein
MTSMSLHVNVDARDCPLRLFAPAGRMLALLSGKTRLGVGAAASHLKVRFAGSTQQAILFDEFKNAYIFSSLLHIWYVIGNHF